MKKNIEFEVVKLPFEVCTDYKGEEFELTIEYEEYSALSGRYTSELHKYLSKDQARELANWILEQLDSE